MSQTLMKNSLKVRKEWSKSAKMKKSSDTERCVCHSPSLQDFLLDKPPQSSDEDIWREGRVDPWRRVPLTGVQPDGLSVWLAADWQRDRANCTTSHPRTLQQCNPQKTPGPVPHPAPSSVLCPAWGLCKSGGNLSFPHAVWRGRRGCSSPVQVRCGVSTPLLPALLLELSLPPSVSSLQTW